MAKKKVKRATWFKFHALENSDFFLALSDQTKAAVFTEMIIYFRKGEKVDISNLGIQDETVKLAFISIKQWIDESLEEYQNAVDYGKKGASGRWGNDETETDSPPIAPL